MARRAGSILVVGAGIAGQALALALTRRDIECDLADQRRTPSALLGMGLNLPGNATRALKTLGVAEEVVARGVPVHRREYRDAQGRLLFGTDDAAFWSGVGPPVCVRHGYLLQALQRHSREADLQHIHARGSVPVGDHVEVSIDGEDSPRRYSFVVGADGVHSSMRPAVSAEPARPSRMTRSSWRLIGDNPGVGCWTAWAGARVTFMLIPVENGRVYGYAASTRGGATGADPEWLGRAFAGFPAPVTQVIDAALSGQGELHHAPVEEVRLERWHRGRLVLIGDAAHATGPVWAQGAAMALEDALVLADLLARHRDWSDVGAAFERLRRARVGHVQAATERMSRLARLPGRLLDLAAPLAGPLAFRGAYGPLRNVAHSGSRAA